MDPAGQSAAGSAELCCRAALPVTAGLWLMWTGPSPEPQTQALFTALLFPPWSKVECGASANVIATQWSHEVG